MTDFKPMLACKADPAKLRFPLYVQPKLDGIRASVVGGQLLTRTLKQVPNREIFEALSKPMFEGLDGELICGDPTAEDCYRRTSSYVTSGGKTGGAWTYYVFDKWNSLGGFSARYEALLDTALPPDLDIQVVPTVTVRDHVELEAAETVLISRGHEGAILRQPNSRYKFGRASKTGQELVKLKRFEDAEAIIVSSVEEMHNGNVAMTNALGRTERSTAKAGKSGKGTLGAWIVRDCETGVEFKVGTGFSAAERADFWTRQDELEGQMIKYKSFKIGVKDKPRHPVFLGFRSAVDIEH